MDFGNIVAAEKKEMSLLCKIVNVVTITWPIDSMMFSIQVTATYLPMPLSYMILSLLVSTQEMQSDESEFPSLFLNHKMSFLTVQMNYYLTLLARSCFCNWALRCHYKLVILEISFPFQPLILFHFLSLNLSKILAY